MSHLVGQSPQEGGQDLPGGQLGKASLGWSRTPQEVAGGISQGWGG